MPDLQKVAALVAQNRELCKEHIDKAHSENIAKEAAMLKTALTPANARNVARLIAERFNGDASLLSDRLKGMGLFGKSLNYSGKYKNIDMGSIDLANARKSAFMDEVKKRLGFMSQLGPSKLSLNTLNYYNRLGGYAAKKELAEDASLINKNLKNILEGKLQLPSNTSINNTMTNVKDTLKLKGADVLNKLVAGKENFIELLGKVLNTKLW